MRFFDTGAWVALAAPADRNAPAARQLYQEVARRVHGAVVTTSFVLDEATSLIRSLTDVDNAARFVRTLLRDPSLTVIWIHSEHFASGLDIFESARDKRWSLTDCTSFAVMRQLGITKAFSFDHNFEQAGFERLP